MDRRSFLKMQAVACGAVVAGGLALPKDSLAQISVPKTIDTPMKRKLGRINFNATTLGLGGQASIQKTPHDIDPVSIIVKAYELGVNYFDTSNVYEKSQVHFGAAFKKLGLVPGEANYSEEKRKSIFLTSKTGKRWANRDTSVAGVRSFSNNSPESGCIDDLKRTLTQVFGDGKGNYPKDAYVDMMMMHSIENMQMVDALYEGYSEPHPSGRWGAFAALRDYRDGTNITGYNPKKEKLIRHIGISGHKSPDVLMAMIQRDEQDILDGLLVAINPNDTLYFNMQHNVIPVAKAKGMGVIGMKIFANGAMYDRVAKWRWLPEDNVRTIGTAALPSHLPIQYALTTPGVDIVIIGMGQISENKEQCQLYQNLMASQVTPQALTATQRKDIEAITHSIKNGLTNYFQNPPVPLTPPREIALKPSDTQNGRKMHISWQTAFAADAPIKEYQIWRDGVKIANISHKPQITLEPFMFEDVLQDKAKHEYKLIAVDENNRSSMTESFII